MKKNKLLTNKKQFKIFENQDKNNPYTKNVNFILKDVIFLKTFENILQQYV